MRLIHMPVLHAFSSDLPPGVYAPKHERVPTKHWDILDNMEAGRFGTLAAPQTCDSNVKYNRSRDVRVVDIT